MMHDVLIIGASLAGSSLAVLLARAGLKVALLDQSAFPRRKACGEGLSAAGLAALMRLGLSEAFSRLPHAPLRGFLIWKNGRFHTLASPGSSPLVGVQRIELDTLLFAAASACPGVTALPRTFAREAENDGRRIRVKTDRGTLSARHLALAAGASSRLPLALGFGLKRGATLRAGCSLPFRVTRGRLPQHVVIFVDEGYEIYATPVTADIVNVAFLGSAASLSDLRCTLSLEEAGARCLAAIDLTAYACGKMRGSACFGRAYAHAWHGSALLVGDCCESFDPIGGMGMSHALLSAECAARALLEIFGTDASPAACLQRYEDERRQAARCLRGLTRLAYMTLVSERRGALLRLMKHLGAPFPLEPRRAAPSGLLPRVLAHAAGFW